MIRLFKNGNFVSSFMLVFALCIAKCIIFKFCEPRKQIYIQSQQWKHTNNVWNLFKVENKDTRTTSDQLQTCLTPSFSVSIVDFEKVNISWALIMLEQSWAFTARFLKCVWPFWHMHYPLKDWGNGVLNPDCII